MRDLRFRVALQRPDAVAACTRALADSAMADTPAVTETSDLIALRAAGDRIAVRRHFHDGVTHAASRPAGAVAAALFDALEAARLDVLGLRWMPGVARNLMSHPGPQPLPIRWLVFEILAEREAPVALAQDVGRLRDTLPPRLLEGLIALRSAIETQPTFAKDSAAWADLAAVQDWGIGALANSVAPEATAQATSMTAAGGEGSDQMEEPRDDASGQQGLTNTHARGRSPGSSASTLDRGAAAYAPYTTAYDRVVDAASLVEPTELARLRARLDSELGETRVAVTRLANRLRRTLMARQARHWQFDLDEGLVDGSRLASVIASPGEARPFKRETESPFPTAAVTLLIDHSGSMRGRPILMAALTAEILVLALERCGVQCEVLGFTTRDWNGGRSYEDWTARGQPENPGRLNALEHVVLKAADVPWRRARHGLGLVLRDDLLKENIDGEAVQWAHARLCRRAERRRILLVVSDGEPRDEATERANGAAYLTRHLRAVVEEIEDHSAVQITAIGVGHDVLRFYSQAITITSVDALGDALNTTLISFLTADENRTAARGSTRRHAKAV